MGVESHLRLIIENYDSPIWLLNEDFEIIDCNDKFKQEFAHLSDKEIGVGNDFFKIVDKENISFWKEKISKTLAEGPQKFVFKEILEGEVKIYDIKTFPNKVDDKQFFISFFVSDVTTLNKFETELEKQNAELTKINRELDNLVYSISHQVRSPISSLMGLVNVAKIDDIENALGYLNMMQKSLGKLDATVHTINEYSKNSRLRLIKGKINFTDLVKEIFIDLGYSRIPDGVRIETKIIEKVPFYSDSERIRVIFSNLLSNAFKFSDLEKAESVISVVVKTDSKSSHIKVTDNGEGIHESLLPRIFDMFYRAANDSRGAGLGLYVVKEVVNKLEGKIKVNSKPGEGTSIEIEIPNMK